MRVSGFASTGEHNRSPVEVQGKAAGVATSAFLCAQGAKEIDGAHDADTLEGLQAEQVSIAGNHEMGRAGNRAFENTVVRRVFGNGIYRDHGNDENSGDLPHDGRRNQQIKSSFSRLPPRLKRQPPAVSEG